MLKIQEKKVFLMLVKIITSGRVFFSNNNLNIIFGSIMKKGHMSDDPMISRINVDYSAESLCSWI